MATKPTKTSTVKAKGADKTRAPKVSRARKNDTDSAANEQTMQSDAEATPARTRGTTPARDAVAQLAYERFIARGYQHGFDVEDWLTAERELSQRQ